MDTPTTHPPEPVRVLVIMAFDLPDAADIVPIIKAIDPPSLPYFVDGVRIAVEPYASRVTRYLDGVRPS